MPVLGHAHYLFLSYAHVETQWVDAFKAAFWQKFHEKGGKAVKIWQDVNSLRFGQKWTAEIEDGVKRAAALLAIVSPSYLTSDWCQEERNILLEHHGGLENLKVDTIYRFLKIVKSPTDYDLFSDLQAVKFFHEGTKEEFALDSREFSVAIGKAVGVIQDLFRLLSNQQTSVYLARGPIEIAAERRQLEEELGGRGYNVRPAFALDANFGAEAMVKEMEPCERVIVLLGGRHDKFVEQQIKQAIALNKPVLSWIHPRLAENATAGQQTFLKHLRERQDLPGGSEILGGQSITALLQQLEPLLKNDPKLPLAANGDASKLSVYLIFDATLSPEAEAAGRVSGILSEHNLAVMQAKSHDDHEELMRHADAALLLRATNAEPDWWLRSNATDLIMSRQMFQKEPDFVAKAFMLAEPARLSLNAGSIPVLKYFSGISAQTLEPFFEKLRRKRSADAGR